ncbi:MAG: hypothetical protein U9N73_08445 [Candidatus Auribacterota bacterium]|nr:hypothetical protein [Candidatus Auribacterota bacterium]
MKSLFHLASEVQALFLKKDWRFCFIGALAVQRWGEPRLTTDIDITLFTGFGKEEPFVDEVLKCYSGRIPDAKNFALTKRVLLLESGNGIGIDISLGALDFEKEAMNRATYYEFLSDVKLLTCSAEDLIILKAFADRSKDWLDIEGIITRQLNKLDWSYIKKHLTPLCELKGEPEIVDKLKSLREKLS